MRVRRYFVTAVAVAGVSLAYGCGGGCGKCVGWGGGVQIFATAGAIDTASVAHVHICVEKTCVDLPAQKIEARPAKPKPFTFPFAFGDVQVAGQELKVEVTLRTASNTVIATGSASSKLWYVNPFGWYCEEEVAQHVGFGSGPALGVEFRSASHLVSVDVRAPKPSCPSANS